MKTIKMLMMAALTIFSVSVFAQDTAKNKIKSTKQKIEKVKYSCPMHPDMVSDKPGQCSKCGMDLTKSKKEQMKMQVMKTYACPMHADVTSDKPGKCSKCGSDMNLSLKEKMKMQVMNKYICPMHSDVTSDKPGKCSKCGMDLAKAKTKTKEKMD